MNFQREESWFLSSEGSSIHQTKYSTGAGYTAYAFAGSEIQKRSYPNSFGGHWQNRGYELIEEMKLLENARRVAEEAVALHQAEQCPEGTATIILDGSQLGLQIHESIGHPIELDRVLGMEANFAGTSFLTLEKLGKLRYGSELVNVVADARQEHGPGLGTFAYDDEGVAAQSTPIITNGRFTGYLSSRETAHTIGAARSGGTLRAEGWNRLPLIRMTNVSILPGEKPLSLEQLIAATDDGIYMETNKSWSIDDKRYNFQFGCEIAWEIKHGKRVRMLKNPSYSGITTEFWNSMDAICSRDEWTLWGTPNCGKGQPQQVVGTGHGASPARFRNIRVGSAYRREAGELVCTSLPASTKNGEGRRGKPRLYEKLGNANQRTIRRHLRPNSPLLVRRRGRSYLHRLPLCPDPLRQQHHPSECGGRELHRFDPHEFCRPDGARHRQSI